MKTVNFKNIRIENFGRFTEPIQSELGNRVIVSGQNGVGKSTIKRAIQYILGTKDENGKEISGIRPHDENGVDIDGLTTVAELTVSVDGAENTLKRTCFQEKNRQGEYTGKDNLQYFVDDVKKGTKKAYDEYVSTIIPATVCISAQELLMKDTAGRREMLEPFLKHTNDDVIDENPKFEELRAGLRANSVDELKKACRDKIKDRTKKRDEVIVEIRTRESDKVDIDLAELELLKNALNEQIAENKAKQENVDRQFEEYDRQTDGIMELKFELSDLERKANEGLHKNALKLTEQQLEKEREIKDLQMQKDSLAYRNKELERNIGFYTSKVDSIKDKWTTASEREFDENSLICSYCGQEYPKEEKERLRAKFESDKAEELKRLTVSGNELYQEAENCKKALEENKKQIKSIDEQLEKLQAELKEIEEEQSKLPQYIDISDREDVKTIKQKIAEKEQAMQKGSSASEIRQQLQDELEDLQRQKAEVQKQFDKADENNHIDERVEELKKQQLALSQEIADVEKELDLLKYFERRKAELLESDVNSHFSIIQWHMFKEMQNGELADICSPYVGGTSYDGNLNFSSKLLAEVDICTAFQKIYDVQTPILLDNAESIDKDRITNVSNQLILFMRSDNKELKIETEV